MESQILEFLASGMTAADAANTVGCSLEKIQELLKNDTFRANLKARGKELQAERIDHKYVQTEEKLLNRIMDAAKDEFTELPSICKALEVVAKNRVIHRNPASAFNPGNPVNLNSMLTLVLPAAALSNDNNVTLNSNSEVVAVGDRNMASLPLESVKRLFNTIDKLRAAGNRNEVSKGKTYDHALQSSSAA